MSISETSLALGSQQDVQRADINHSQDYEARSWQPKGSQMTKILQMCPQRSYSDSCIPIQTVNKFIGTNGEGGDTHIFE
jgi:hypothetical protein